jgi:hypothetical protein
MINAFLQQPCKAYRNFQLVMTPITLNFAFPSLSYAIAPQLATDSLTQVSRIVGGVPFVAEVENASLLWRALASSNVMTLAFMCFLLQYNLRRYYAVLVPLAFLKLTSATLFLVIAITTGQRAYGSITLLDGGTGALFVAFTVLAHRAIEGLPDDSLVPRPR